jgi:4-hydroxy-3-methylbut-2-enyl diphosphate reductase
MSAPVLLAPLRTEAAAARFGTRRQPGVRVERIGMGHLRAAASAARLAAQLPPSAPVAVVGFAGGLDKADRAGDLVVASELRSFGEPGDGSQLDREVAEKVTRRLGSGLGRARLGPVVCTKRLLGKNEKAAAVGEGGERALACEMESAWLAPLSKGRPFVVVRTIVDRPGRPVFGPWTLFSGFLAWRRLAAAAALVVQELEQD